MATWHLFLFCMHTHAEFVKFRSTARPARLTADRLCASTSNATSSGASPESVAHTPRAAFGVAELAMNRTAETVEEDATSAFIDAAEREAQRLAKLKARTKAKVAAKAAAWAAAERAAEMAELAETTGKPSRPTEDDECGLRLEDNDDNDDIILFEENDDDMPSLEENDDDMPSLEENAGSSNDSSSAARRRLNILQSPPCQLQPPPVLPQSPKLSAAFGSAHGLGSGLLGLAASPSCSTACGMSLLSCSSAHSASTSPAASGSASPTPAAGVGLPAHSPRANRKNLVGGVGGNGNNASSGGTGNGSAHPGRSPRANRKNACGAPQAQQQQQQGTQRSTPPGTPQITPPAQRRGGSRNGNKQPPKQPAQPN